MESSVESAAAAAAAVALGGGGYCCGGRIRLPKDGTGRLRAAQGGAGSLTWPIRLRLILGAELRQRLVANFFHTVPVTSSFRTHA